MITHRRLAIAVLGALVIVVVSSDQLGAIVVLLLTAVGYAIWSIGRGEWTRHDRPSAAPDQRQAELVSARVGEPTHSVARFISQTQHAPQERWHGEERLWMAVSDTWVWLLHQTHDGDIGGVKVGSRGLACTAVGLTTGCGPTTRENCRGPPIPGLSPASCTRRGPNGCVSSDCSQVTSSGSATS